MTPLIVTPPYLINYVIKNSNKITYKVPLKFMYLKKNQDTFKAMLLTKKLKENKLCDIPKTFSKCND
jgi:hypothetical protein